MFIITIQLQPTNKNPLDRVRLKRQVLGSRFFNNQVVTHGFLLSQSKRVLLRHTVKVVSQDKEWVMCSRLAKMTHLITVLSKVAIRYSCSCSLFNCHQGKESHLVRLRGIQWGHKTNIRIRSIEWTPVLQTAVVFLGDSKGGGKKLLPARRVDTWNFPARILRPLYYP